MGLGAAIAVAAGSVAGMAAVTHLLFAPLLLATLLVGIPGLDANPAAVLAAAGAWLTRTGLDRPLGDPTAKRAAPQR